MCSSQPCSKQNLSVYLKDVWFIYINQIMQRLSLQKVLHRDLFPKYKFNIWDDGGIQSFSLMAGKNTQMISIIKYENKLQLLCLIHKHLWTFHQCVSSAFPLNKSERFFLSTVSLSFCLLDPFDGCKYMEIFMIIYCFLCQTTTFRWNNWNDVFLNRSIKFNSYPRPPPPSWRDMGQMHG